MTEAQVVAFIRSGRPVDAVARQGEQWWDPRHHPAFASALRPRPKSRVAIYALVAALVLAIVVLKALASATPSSPAPAKPDDEVAMRTLPLEAGEGAARGQVFTLYTDHGELALASGDRLERLQERAERRSLVKAPSDAVRVRVLAGDLKGEVGYVRPIYIQAAR